MENTLLQKIKQKFGMEYDGIILDAVVLYQSRRLINIEFSGKRVFNDEEKSKLERYITSLFPENHTLTFEYSKRYCDEDIARREIKNYITSNYPSIKTYIKSIECIYNQNAFDLKITLEDIVADYAKENRMKDEIKKYLTDKFCFVFNIELIFVETEEAELPAKLPDVIKEESTEEAIKQRIVEVNNVELFVGKEITTTPKYIVDYITTENPDLTLCGTISYFTKRTSAKSGKDFFNFTLSDFTGKISCVIFPSKANADKVATLVDGTQIVANGVCEFDTYKKSNSFFVKNISLCEMPTDFVAVEKPSLPVPDSYKTVFPRPIEITSQVDLFGERKVDVPPSLKDKTFVVFDIETTGLNFDLDKMTEIGAVKIVNGVITETFSSLINPQVTIRAETIALNGIDNELVKNSPLVKDVLPDFFRFCENSSLVAHNIDFDIKFVKYNADKLGYYFYHELNDTLRIARAKIKGLSNYKLDTLCEHFAIELKDHHRAWHDALATSHLFMELMRVDEKSETTIEDNIA